MLGKWSFSNNLLSITNILLFTIVFFIDFCSLTMKKFILFFLLTIFVSAIKAQTDTAFWFAAPEVTYNGGSLHSDRPIYLRLTTLSKPASVTISEPANAGFVTKTVNIAAYSSASIDLTPDIDQIESKPPNTVLNYGLYIQSTNLITAYYEESSQNNPEMFVLKGSNALGKSFFIPSQTLMDNDSTKVPAAYSSFDIVATQDNTTINITPSKDIVGHKAGITFIIMLNKGQVFSSAAIAYLAAGHLAGSIVTSDKPIAITIKDDSIGGGGYYACLDLAGDQIVPLSIIGTKYISIPGYLNNAPPPTPPTDWLFILATQNNTVVNINGVQEATLNAGQTYKRGVHDSTLYIDASLPVYALHLSGFSCEVGHALLPTIECTGSSTVGFTRSMNIPLFMNILVPTGGETGFTFNGGTTVINAAMFKPVPFSAGQWQYARIQVSTSDLPAGSGAVVANSLQEFHLGVIHGDNNGCRYGYFSDFNHFPQKLSTSAANNTVCQNDVIQLQCDVGATLHVNYQWTGPNGFSSNQQNPLINSVSLNNSGTYYCNASKTNCTTLNDSIVIKVNKLPDTKIQVNNPVCTSSAANFSSVNAVVGSSDIWIGPGNNIVSLNTSFTKSINSMSDSGRYILKESFLGCSKNDTVKLLVDTTPIVSVTCNTNPCKFQYLSFEANVSLSGSVFSVTGPNGYNAVKLKDTIYNYTEADTGKYTFTATLNGCTSTTTIVTRIKPIPIVQFSPLDSVCENLPAFIIHANEITGIPGYSQFSGQGISDIHTGQFNPKLSGSGTHLISYTFHANDGCDATASQPIKVLPAPFVTTTPTQTVFTGNTALLQTVITGAYNNIAWSPITTLNYPNIVSPIASPLYNTIYIINVYNDDGCEATDTAEVRVVNNIKIPNSFSPNGDGINDFWEIKDLNGINKVTVYIFDRNGQKVYNYTGNKISWDGKYAGTPAPIGTYYYLVKLFDDVRSENYSGWILLIR